MIPIFMVLQNDIHAPGTTVYEALEFSAQMRIMDVDKHQLKDFVDQVRAAWCCFGPVIWISSCKRVFETCGVIAWS